ncbi:MAG: hypothetical protein ACE5GX_15865 [Thermoanaerobaculia bacterium]
MRITRTTFFLSTALAAFALVLVPAPAAGQVCHIPDTYAQRSLCVGFDCPCGGLSFGFDTIRLQENNTRIKFNDTSTSASFPSNDWQLTANDSSNGGVNHFSIEDVTGGKTPFRVEAGAPSFSLMVEADGDVGINTQNPVVELHVVDGDSPTLRLEQDGSEGFTPQTWDVAGNETNFFVRDVTGGSKLPFRIKPTAPTDSLFIAASGDVGMGTDSPEANLHVKTSATGAGKLLLLEKAGNTRFEMENSSSGEKWQLGLSGGTGSDFIINQNTAADGNEVVISGAGDVTIQGNIITTSCPAGCGPDYVFEPDYELMPLRDLETYIAEKKHLPNVPPAVEMETQGINVTQLQLRMLEKIEELTLYTLAQQTEITELRAMVEELRVKR